jgi:TonB family protein
MGPSYSPRRTVTFILVASLHAAVFAGLILGLTAKLKKTTPPDFQTVIIDKRPPPVETPKIDKPDLSNPVIDASPPRDIHIEADPPVIPDEPKADATETLGREVAPPEPPHAAKRVSGAPGTGFPSTSDYYPDIAIRKGQQGSAAVNVCVDVKGRLTSSPSILQSSGTATLDQAALRLAKAGSGHYQPAKEDGRPIESCYGFLIQFILK